ncbi:MAG: dockerin type I domain-containing protein, partial [Bacteroidota bacterium]
NPVAGTYTARIMGQGIALGPQVYWLVYEWHTDQITMTYPMGGESFVSGETEILRWDATGNTGPFTLQWSSNNGQSWTTIASNLAASVRHYSWVVPSTTSGQIKIRVSSGAVVSESAQPLNISPLVTNIAFPTVCSTSLTLSWSAVTGAGRYIIHRLGARYMDSIGTTTSTTFTVNGTNLGSEDWYAITPIGTNNAWRGRRSNAVSKPLTGPINCTGGSVIGGTLVYGNTTQSPMTNTTIVLKQNNAEIGRDTTDAQGIFSLGNRPAGTYILEYQTNKAWGGVNATDALGINRHFSNVGLLSGLFLLAADVNASNSINATDALVTARRFSNVISTMPAGDWRFETGSLNLVSGGTYNNLLLRTLTFGDVNGSYIPPAN